MTILLLIGTGLYLLVGIGVWISALRTLRGMSGIRKLAYVTTFIFSIVWPLALVVGIVKRRRYRAEQEAVLERMLETVRQRAHNQRPPFSTHPDAAYGGQEHVRLCFNPNCPCRGHERDKRCNPAEIERPEDYWR